MKVSRYQNRLLARGAQVRIESALIGTATPWYGHSRTLVLDRDGRYYTSRNYLHSVLAYDTVQQQE